MIAQVQTACSAVSEDICNLEILMDDAIGQLMSGFSSIAEAAQAQQDTYQSGAN